MPQVKVITFARLRQIIGKKQFTMNAESIEDLLEKLFKEHGKELKKELFDGNGQLKHIYRIVVNGRSITLLDGFKTKLKDNDMVALMPAIAGG